MDILPRREFERRYRFGRIAVAAPVVIRFLAMNTSYGIEIVIMLASLAVALTTLWWLTSRKEPERRVLDIEWRMTDGMKAVRTQLWRSLIFDCQWLMIVMFLVTFTALVSPTIVAPSLMKLVMLFPIAGSGIAFRWFLYESWILDRLQSTPAPLPSTPSLSRQ